MEDALEIEGLVKAYPGFALRDVSLRLPRGYICGLIGPNGAGKTTLVKCVLNIVRRDAGRVRIGGLDTLEQGAEARSRIGFVLDEPPLYGHLSAAAMGAVVAPFYRDWDRGLFTRLCREFEVPARRRAAALSRGTRLKLALALALSHRAELVVMDEPTAGLDPVFRRELLDRLAGVIRDGRASVLFSTHITSDLERVADFVACLRGGRLLFSASREALRDSWAIVRGGLDLLAAAGPSLFRAVRRGLHGFEALTDRAGEAHRLPGAVVEPATLDEIVYYLSREAPDA